MHQRGETFRYLAGEDVRAAMKQVDVVQVVEEAFRAHARGRTVLPEEAYLGWTTEAGHAARCLAMPGAIEVDGARAVGLKTINASLGNTAAGLSRSQGFTLLLDPESARPSVLMEAAYVSAMRTAAATAVAALRLGAAPPAALGLIGCGVLGEAHVRLLADPRAGSTSVVLFDLVPGRAEALARALRADLPGLRIRVAGSARECVGAASLLVTATTVTEGYIPAEWLADGAMVAHVSLDDLCPDAVLAADLVVVDDWGLVSQDPRRLLGRMYRSGQLLGPDGCRHPDAVERPDARRVDAGLGEICLDDRARPVEKGVKIVFNPFGMAVLDVAVAEHVRRAAQSLGLGSELPL